MKQLFNHETEIGKWEGEDFIPGTSPWGLFVHTTALLTRARDLVRIEQRCFLRREGEITEQPWVPARLFFEASPGSEAQIKRMTGRIHEEFAGEARRVCPLNSLVYA